MLIFELLQADIMKDKRKSSSSTGREIQEEHLILTKQQAFWPRPDLAVASSAAG